MQRLEAEVGIILRRAIHDWRSSMTFSAGDVVLVPFSLSRPSCRPCPASLRWCPRRYLQHSIAIRGCRHLPMSPRVPWPFALGLGGAQVSSFLYRPYVCWRPVASATHPIHVWQPNGARLDRGPAATTHGLHVTVGAQVMTEDRSNGDSCGCPCPGVGVEAHQC